MDKILYNLQRFLPTESFSFFVCSYKKQMFFRKFLLLTQIYQFKSFLLNETNGKNYGPSDVFRQPQEASKTLTTLPILERSNSTNSPNQPENNEGADNNIQFLPNDNPVDPRLEPTAKNLNASVTTGRREGSPPNLAPMASNDYRQHHSLML